MSGATVIIPARFASTRYPGKPLVELTGRTGVTKSLIRRTWDKACLVEAASRVVIATDDDRIREHAESFGAEVIMTPVSCRNGTERCAAALEEMGDTDDVIVNFQGDAPMTPSWFVDDLIESVHKNPGVDVATPILNCDAITYQHFIEDRQNGRVGGTTAVFGTDMKALYFSKEVLPYAEPGSKPDLHRFVYHHVGVYAYRKHALLEYPKLKIGFLEQLEGLEQLRFLENEHTILCVEVDAKGQLFWELNNPVDVKRIEENIE